MHARARLLLAAILALALSWLAGCFGGTSAPTRFYTLAPTARVLPDETGDSSRREIALEVGPVTMPGYLDRPQIVTRRGRDEVELAEFDLWSEPLKESVPRTLGENLGILLQTERITLFPRRGTRVAQYRLVVDVTRFEGSMGGDLVLDARWRIEESRGKGLVVRRSTLHEATGAPGYAALVGAMSRALGRLSQDVAVACRELLQ
jgi:uncharacterized protein